MIPATTTPATTVGVPGWDLSRRLDEAEQAATTFAAALAGAAGLVPLDALDHPAVDEAAQQATQWLADRGHDAVAILRGE